ncbi:MAG: hypothetical protein JW699_04545 [Chitinispirillaceae bacterium]|nr:hypothetical protein [Chitinispirillaceae bacterium]
MNTPSAPLTSQIPASAGASTQGDDPLALIRAARLMGKNRKWIALGTLLFTARGIR